MRESEYMKRLTDYIHKNLKKGYPADSLKWALVRQGYSRTAVEKAIEQVKIEMARSAPILEDKPVITHEIVEDMPQKSWWRRLLGL